jgi:SAM-dependent methyltransferase
MVEEASGTPEPQGWNPDRYRKNAAFVAELGSPLIDSLGAIAGRRILDLGCGDGVLTARMIEAGASVLGVDASPSMVEAAKARGIDAIVADAADLSFEKKFDAVVSNAALHWMSDQKAVVGNVYRALRPGGRFVAECGGYMNVAAIRVALHAALENVGADAARLDPWTFTSVPVMRGLLEDAGFAVESLDWFARPTPLPTDIRGWLLTFAQSFVTELTEEQSEAVLDEAERLLAVALRDEAGAWTADYVRLRFAALKPEGAE